MKKIKIELRANENKELVAMPWGGDYESGIDFLISDTSINQSIRLSLGVEQLESLKNAIDFVLYPKK